MASRAEQVSTVSQTSDNFTTHARNRMSGRSINEWQIDQVIRYGREAHTRSAVIYAIGRKEIKYYGRFLEPCEGIHVLCSPQDGAIITTYRNRDFSGLKH